MGKSTWYGMIDGQVDQGAATRAQKVGYNRIDCQENSCSNCKHRQTKNRQSRCLLHRIRIHVDGSCKTLDQIVVPPPPKKVLPLHPLQHIVSAWVRA